MAGSPHEGTPETAWGVGALVGSYRILRRIAVGGMAEVYEAEHVRLGARVAVKRLLPSFAGRPEIARRLLREARAASTLLHPNIVRVHDIEASEASMHLVMELIDGPDLRSYLDERAPLSSTEMTALLGPVFDAIAFAHARGVVHRDLKPANILVGTTHDGSLRPMVADFGLAHGTAFFADSLVTDDQQLLGTPAYFAPELCDDRGRPTAASDQYALGVIAYEALTGRRPHEGTNLASLVRNILDAPVVPPRTHRDEVPEAVSDAVTRSLSRAPSDRFSSVAAFASALGMQLAPRAHEARPAPPDPAADRAARDASLAPMSVTPTKFRRRVSRRASAALAAALLLTLALWRSAVSEPSRSTSRDQRHVSEPVRVPAPARPSEPSAPSPTASPGGPSSAPNTSGQRLAFAVADAGVVLRARRRPVAERRPPGARVFVDAGENPRCIGPNGVNLCL